MRPAQAFSARLLAFDADALALVDELPATAAGRHVGLPLVRCATSPAANYAEARGAESRADFVHELRIALKEINEAAVWLALIARRKMVDGLRVDPLVQESAHLVRMLGASVSTAKTRAANAPRRPP